MTVQELYTNIGGNYERVKNLLQMDKLIARFIVKLPNDTSFEKLLSAWSAGDRQGMFEGAHALKGVCGNLGLDELAAAASRVTEEFRPGNTPTLSREELDAHMQQLRDRYEQTVETIRSFAAEQG